MYIPSILDLINTVILLAFIAGGFVTGYWYAGQRIKKQEEDYEPF
jgi:hypothetical protein